MKKDIVNEFSKSRFQPLILANRETIGKHVKSGGKGTDTASLWNESMKKYQIIYADPPWSYRNKKTGGSMNSGAKAKYPTLTVKEICELPIRDIAASNSVLFLWATVPLLPEAFEVMRAWGYKYKTMLTWRKIMSLGMGFWFRGQTEHLLVGVKGKVKAFRIQKPNFIQSKAGKHSEKPQEFRELIELIKLQPRIELFARQKTPGWTVWGNEVESDIEL